MKKPNLSRTLHRGLAMILAFALLLGMLPAAVQAAPASSDGGPVTSGLENGAEQRLLDMLDQENGLQKAELMESAYDPDEVVTVIVSLEDVPATVLGSTREKEAQHQRVQMEIADLVAAKSSDSIHATAEDPAAGAFAVRYDYYEVMNGFAADVEPWTLWTPFMWRRSLPFRRIRSRITKMPTRLPWWGLTAARIPATAR